MFRHKCSNFPQHFPCVFIFQYPTNPSVATLMRTSGGKTERRALKQAIKVEPEYRLNRVFL